MTFRRSTAACEPCPIPSQEHGHKAEHREDLQEEEADFQADKAEGIQEAMVASNSLSTTGCHEHQLDQTE